MLSERKFTSRPLPVSLDGGMTFEIVSQKKPEIRISQKNVTLLQNVFKGSVDTLSSRIRNNALLNCIVV
jgi:hypothetical protein